MNTAKIDEDRAFNAANGLTYAKTTMRRITGRNLKWIPWSGNPAE